MEMQQRLENIENLKKTVSSKKGKLSSFHDEMADLDRQLSINTKRYEELEVEHENLTKAISELTDENNRWTSKDVETFEEVTDKCARVVKEMGEVDSNIRVLQAEMTSTKNRIETLTKDTAAQSKKLFELLTLFPTKR